MWKAMVKEGGRNTLPNGRELSQVTQSPNQLSEALGAAVPPIRLFLLLPIGCLLCCFYRVFVHYCWLSFFYHLISTAIFYHPDCTALLALHYCVDPPFTKLYLHNTLVVL